ncbi:phosphate/phosphite/phosphonate ABC transporter substrate-binding protein [Candidatus Thiodiazotropha sp. CDECU1]|uniref:phosphate/phosphite/phosphonate ABC transporter substrate-binding protein n=1 Tax=Candidatus Thiodiazotropha sp. CDECU1 TaxID=3065865 RepID=UPI00292FFB24|nr:PhnD/SsuA/transferrin family substrate-binding protein [Candidatus Thiodiazotropha sp. CDECU1]
MEQRKIVKRLSPHRFRVHLVLFLIAANLVTGVMADPLLIGIFPRRDAIVTANLFRPLSNYLEEHLQQPVKLELSANFDVFMQRLQQRRYDLVHLNQFEYVNAHEKLAYEAIVQNEEFGEKMIRGAIYVRQDSGIKELEQLRGKEILFGGGPRAMMSYIVPTYLLRQAGLEAGDYQETYAINPPKAVISTFLKYADAGGAGEVVRRLPMVRKKIDVNDLAIIAVSDPLPHLPWAVKEEMDDDLKTRIKNILLGLKASPRGKEILRQARLSAFNPVNDKDYDAHRVIINAIYPR